MEATTMEALKAVTCALAARRFCSLSSGHAFLREMEGAQGSRRSSGLGDANGAIVPPNQLSALTRRFGTEIRCLAQGEEQAVERGNP